MVVLELILDSISSVVGCKGLLIFVGWLSRMVRGLR